MSSICISKPSYNLSRIKNKKVDLRVSDFCETLKNNISSDNLVLFNKNILNLKVNFSYFLKEKILHNNYIVGEYLPYHNLIRINKLRCNGTIDHELLHVASTYCTEDRKVYSGFSLQSLDNSDDKSLGFAFTEGYTEILRNRYFKKNANDERSYDLQKCFASLIEKIIGKDKMESYYFNADFKGFISDVSQYTNINDAENFLKAVDDFSYSNNYPQTVNALKYIYRFIIDCYLNKEFKDNDDYNDNNKMKKFTHFYNGLPKEFDYKGRIYNVNIVDIVNSELLVNKSKNKCLRLN